MKRLALTLIAVLCTISTAAVLTERAPIVVASVADAHFGPALLMLPPGAQLAVLSGNPMGTGCYAVRVCRRH